MWVSLYENVVEWDEIQIGAAYPVLVNGRYLMSPSPIPRWDTPKLHQAETLFLFAAGREAHLRGSATHRRRTARLRGQALPARALPRRVRSVGVPIRTARRSKPTTGSGCTPVTTRASAKRQRDPSIQKAHHVDRDVGWERLEEPAVDAANDGGESMSGPARVERFPDSEADDDVVLRPAGSKTVQEFVWRLRRTDRRRRGNQPVSDLRDDRRRRRRRPRVTPRRSARHRRGVGLRQVESGRDSCARTRGDRRHGRLRRVRGTCSRRIISNAIGCATRRSGWSTSTSATG